MFETLTGKKLQTSVSIQRFASLEVTTFYVNFRGMDIVKMLRWMNVKQRFQYFNIILIFKCIHGLAPQYLCNNITIACEIALNMFKFKLKKLILIIA